MKGKIKFNLPDKGSEQCSWIYGKGVIENPPSARTTVSKDISFGWVFLSNYKTDVTVYPNNCYEYLWMPLELPTGDRESNAGRDCNP